MTNSNTQAASSSQTKTVVAHLGAHKTATSLVQRYFKSKKKYYMNQGVLPLTRGEVSPFISWGDVVIKDPSKLNSFLKSKSRNVPVSHILISNENALGKPFKTKPGLYPDHAKIIRAFVEAFDGFQPRIVYSIRPQWEFLESYYLQRVHQGYYLTFNQYVNDIDLTRISWVPIVEELRKHFGKENVSVMDFNTIKKGQSIFLGEFVEQNISPKIVPDLNYHTVHNASISDRGLQMALRVNPLLQPGESGTVRRFLQQHFSNSTEPRPALMRDDMRSEMKERYADEYAALIKKD